MALDPSALQSGLEALATPPNHPPDESSAGQAWADAVEAWVTGIVPPSTTVATAAATLASDLESAFASSDAAPIMETAFATFAAAVGSGMTGYTSTPPPGLVGFATQFAGPYPPDPATAASEVAGIIDAWMRTGSSTLIAPPHTVVVWS